MVGGELGSGIVRLTNEIDPVAKPVLVSLSLPGVSGGSKTFARARRAIENPRSFVRAYGILIRGVKVTNGIAYIRTVMYIRTSRTYIYVFLNVCLLAGTPSSIPFLCPYWFRWPLAHGR